MTFRRCVVTYCFLPFSILQTRMLNERDVYNIMRCNWQSKFKRFSTYLQRTWSTLTFLNRIYLTTRSVMYVHSFLSVIHCSRRVLFAHFSSRYHWRRAGIKRFLFSVRHLFSFQSRVVDPCQKTARFAHPLTSHSITTSARYWLTARCLPLQRWRFLYFLRVYIQLKKKKTLKITVNDGIQMGTFRRTLFGVNIFPQLYKTKPNCESY